MTQDHNGPQLDGPRIEPLAGGPAQQLVIFLHGYGADGNDLIDIGRAWQALLPHAAFVSPHAPQPCDQSPMGRQWFPLTIRDTHERWAGLQAATPLLHAFIAAELARRQLPPSALALVGFSQGAMMALHVGLQSPEPLAGIVSYSGAFILPEGADAALLGAEVRSQPPVLLMHGDADDVIPVQALFQATTRLSALAVPLEWHVTPGLGHGIDQEALRRGGEFLTHCFAGEKAVPPLV